MPPLVKYRPGTGRSIDAEVDTYLCWRCCVHGRRRVRWRPPMPRGGKPEEITSWYEVRIRESSSAAESTLLENESSQRSTRDADVPAFPASPDSHRPDSALRIVPTGPSPTTIASGAGAAEGTVPRLLNLTLRQRSEAPTHIAEKTLCGADASAPAVPQRSDTQLPPKKPEPATPRPTDGSLRSSTTYHYQDATC